MAADDGANVTWDGVKRYDVGPGPAWFPAQVQSVPLTFDELVTESDALAARFDQGGCTCQLGGKVWIEGVPCKTHDPRWKEQEKTRSEAAAWFSELRKKAKERL